MIKLPMDFLCTHCDEAQPSQVEVYLEACEPHLEPTVGRGRRYLDISSLRGFCNVLNSSPDRLDD